MKHSSLESALIEGILEEKEDEGDQHFQYGIQG